MTKTTMYKQKIKMAAMFLLTLTLVAGTFINANAATKITPTLSKKKVTVTVGKKKTVKVKNTTKKISWKSSNKKIATVKKKGVYGAIITGKKAGKCTITAKVGKKKLKCKVTVKAKRKSKTKNIKNLGKYLNIYSPTKVCVGDKVDLFGEALLGSEKYEALLGSGKYTPSIISKFTQVQKTSLFKFSSSDKSVATINKYGVIKAKKPGTTTITVKFKASSRWKTETKKLTVIQKNAVKIEVTTGIEDAERVQKAKDENEDTKGLDLFDMVTVKITNNTSQKMTVTGVGIGHVAFWNWNKRTNTWDYGTPTNGNPIDCYQHELFDPGNLISRCKESKISIPAKSSKTYTFYLNKDFEEDGTFVWNSFGVYGVSSNSGIGINSNLGKYTCDIKTQKTVFVW